MQRLFLQRSPLAGPAAERLASCRSLGSFHTAHISHSQGFTTNSGMGVTCSARAGAPSAATDTASQASLWQAIQFRYEAAQQSAASSLTDTNTEIIRDGGIDFVLRVAAKLRDKPKPAADSPDGPKKEWRNPFLPYDPALWVADVDAAHVLLLNKFNIVPWHCLVVTADFQRQEDDLNAADLGATWQVMQSMPGGGLSFFNCGPNSGASQPHKHLQIVPLPLDDPAAGQQGNSIDRAAAGQSGQPPIWPAVAEGVEAVAAGEVAELHSLPYAAFAAALQQDVPPDAASQYLAGVYNKLLGRCSEFVSGRLQRADVTAADGSLSYNMVMTSGFMMLVPRRAECDGPLSCNSVAFAGSLFVKSRDEQQYVKERGPMQILAATGYPW